MTVRAEHLKIPNPVVKRVAINMMEFEGDGPAHPLRAPTLFTHRRF
jgi:hypothetical protein